MFYKDLERGRFYEKKFLDIFDILEYEEPDKENQSYYDYKITLPTGKIRYIEVKADFIGCKTGNFALEYECNNKISGINRTKADYYIIFIVGVGIYKIKTKILKEMTMKNYKSVYGGDNMKSKMWLIPIKDLEKYKIDNKI
jgi:hypothetical protein